jgi:ABC-type nitrate/sulfonate/bicarbonate transport system substrate-binding protein
VVNPMDRRSFLRRGAFGVAGVTVLPAVLAACGSDDDSDAADATTTTAAAGGGASEETPDYGTLDYQLSWIKNVEFAGEYLADTKGYYEEVGFSSVNLMAGGPNVQQDAVVASGKAFLCISAPDITSSAINQGAELIAVGAQYQKNPFCVMSLASNPIAKPEDMYGKKIGVQSVNEPVWNAFITAAGLDASKITKVPAQFDPQPLVNKEVDGWFSFVTNEPNLLKTKGIDTVTFLLNDHGYPMVSEIIVVKKESLTKDRDKLKAVLVADLKGWRDSYADPTAAPKLVVSNYGKDLGLDEAEQVLESKAQNELIFTADTKANGLFTLTDELIEETVKTLGVAGIKMTAEKLFDLSVLDEVLEENPDLKTIS